MFELFQQGSEIDEELQPSLQFLIISVGAMLVGPVNLPDGNGGIRWEDGTLRRVLCLPSPSP